METPSEPKPIQKRVYVKPAPHPADVWAQVYCAVLAAEMQKPKRGNNEAAQSALLMADSSVVEYLKRYQKSASRLLAIKDSKRERIESAIPVVMAEDKG